MYKVLNGLAPSSLADLFVPQSDIAEYDLRGFPTSLQLPHPKTEKLKKSFSYSPELSFGILCQQICVIPTRLRTLKMEYTLSNSDLVSYIML